MHLCLCVQTLSVFLYPALAASMQRH